MDVNKVKFDVKKVAKGLNTEYKECGICRLQLKELLKHYPFRCKKP